MAPSSQIAGVRPKLQGPGESSHDFALQGPADHGVKGLVNLLALSRLD